MRSYICAGMYLCAVFIICYHAAQHVVCYHADTVTYLRCCWQTCVKLERISILSFRLRGVLASSNLLVYCKSILRVSVTVFCRASLQPPDLWKPPLTVDCSDWAGTAASQPLCQRPAPHWICPRCWCSFSHSKSAFSSSGSASVHLSLPEEVF